MGLFSKCDASQEKYSLKMIFFITMALVLSSAFFIPPELCQFYVELCQTWRFLIYFDKVFHFLFFAGLIFIIPCKRRKITIAFLFLVLLIVGIGIEAIQSFIPRRGTSLEDIIANVLGLIAGLLIKLHCSKNTNTLKDSSS